MSVTQSADKTAPAICEPKFTFLRHTYDLRSFCPKTEQSSRTCKYFPRDNRCNIRRYCTAYCCTALLQRTQRWFESLTRCRERKPSIDITMWMSILIFIKRRLSSPLCVFKNLQNKSAFEVVSSKTVRIRCCFTVHYPVQSSTRRLKANKGKVRRHNYIRHFKSKF